MPQYWGIWLVLAIFLPLVYLPLSVQFAIGKGFGLLFYKLSPSRRKVTLVNLRLAFPEKTEEQREQMARQVFINQGIGVFETLSAWLRPSAFANCETIIDGLEHITTALDKGKGVLLLGGHYTTLDAGGLLATQYFPVSAVYRPQNNALLERFVYNGRRNLYGHQIHYRQIKALDEYLKEGHVIWYATDQDYGLRRGVMADFFGVPSATVTAGRYLATLGDKDNPPAVIALNTCRIDGKDKLQYKITLTPALDNYPSEDEVYDATRVNKILEELIRIEPTQWMWFHKRYKNCESGRTNYYD